MFISGSPTSGLTVSPIGSFCSALSSVVSRLFVLLPSSDVNRSLVDLIDLFLNTPWSSHLQAEPYISTLPIHSHTMSPTPMSPINRLAHPERTSSQDSTDGIRKRVCKACDRCRLKKSKCDGSSPCSRCKADNAICVFGYVSASWSSIVHTLTGLVVVKGNDHKIKFTPKDTSRCSNNNKVNSCLD